MALVIAIDVGIKNLGLCAYDFVTSQIVHWDNAALVQNGRYTPSQNVQYVRDFVWKHSHLFQNCHTLIIERQMRCNMRIIESVFQTLYFDRCQVMNPRSIKMHYNLSARNYRGNKQKAVAYADKFTGENPQIFTEALVEKYQKSTKKDDYADALLMVLYYLDTYSNQLNVQ